MTDGTGTSTYTYDSLGRLTVHTDGASATVGYEYDLRGLLTSLNYPGLGAVTYTWDDAGRVDAVTDWADRTFTYSHDANGNVTNIEFPASSGNIDEFTYDHANRMTASTTTHDSTTTSTVQYGRNPVGQVTATAQSGLPGGDQNYGYTVLDQLCYAAPAGTGGCDDPPSGATTYTYDPADNLTATAAAATQQFNVANQLCWASQIPATGACDTPPVGATTFSYDTRGNRAVATPAAGDPTTYVYDQANRLTATAGAVTSSYTYDGDGLRTESIIEGATSSFTWSQTGGLPLILTDGTNAYIYGPNGLPLAHQDSDTGDVVYYHHDQLGSTRLLTGADGATLGTATYDPYGNLTDSTGETSPLGFAGQYTDPHTGLQYLRARYYDPTTGQFLTRDPIADLTRQPYAYAANNPVNYIDPLGLAPWDPIKGFLDDHSDDIATFTAVASMAAYVTCPFTAGVGCTVGMGLSSASVGFSAYSTIDTCYSAGVLTRGCGLAALDTGLTAASIAVPGTFMLKGGGRHSNMQYVWESQAAWNFGAGSLALFASHGASVLWGGRGYVGNGVNC
jgi:RHS repeat-associated protein